MNLDSDFAGQARTELWKRIDACIDLMNRLEKVAQADRPISPWHRAWRNVQRNLIDYNRAIDHLNHYRYR